jgi:TM2 domain-containing membrane protein YozV
VFCPSCGAQNQPSSRFCLQCGAALIAAPQGVVADLPRQHTPVPGQPVYARDKNAAVALILSLIIVGLGQLYNGDVKKGLLMFAGAFVGGLLTLGLVWLGLAIWAAIDAYNVASGKTPLWV